MLGAQGFRKLFLLLHEAPVESPKRPPPLDALDGVGRWLGPAGDGDHALEGEKKDDKTERSTHGAWMD